MGKSCWNELKFGMEVYNKVKIKKIIKILIGRSREWSLGPHTQNELKFGMEVLFSVCMKRNIEIDFFNVNISDDI